jgi:creatinine amidohydrolase
MRLDELNWMDVEEYLKRDDRLIIILGACEQHGYLSLLTDVKIPLALADAASEKTDVLVAPPLNFGVSPYFLAYPGTVSLTVHTLLNVVEDITRSIYRQGFRRLLILNGHGGNEPARSRWMELINELPGLKINWYSWWTAQSVVGVAERHGLKPYHASWSEAFPFVRVSDLPAGEKIPPAYQGVLSSEQARQVFGDGVFGGQYQVNDRILDEVFQEALKDILYLLDF